MHPSNYGLPHDSFRKHQLQIIQDAHKWTGWVFAEAPTGSGKTAIPAALAHTQTVTALVKTKDLQARNYRDVYGFDILFGRGNYPCARHVGKMGNSCTFPRSFNNCPQSDMCEYLIKKATARRSPKRCLNYSYYLTSQWPRNEPSSVLVCDEADELSDIVIDHAGVTISEKDRREWNLPELPGISSSKNLLGDSPIYIAQQWLSSARQILRDTWKRLRSEENHDKLRACEKIGTEIGNALNSIITNSSDWYIRSMPNQELIAKPLTARHFFPMWFSGSDLVIMMSATIGGDGSTLATELGLDSWQFYSVPHQYSAEMRPILIPDDTPRLGKKAPPSAYDLQADIATRLIKDRPPDWPGLVLVTSKAEAVKVAERLIKKGLEDRVWVTPEKHNRRYCGTEMHAQLWQERMQQVPGSLCVTWNFWRGYDGTREKILLAMKTPFPYIGAPGSYENERMRAGGGIYQWRTANLLAQGCGRTRRGRQEDYGPDNGLVAVLDANWTMVKKHLPQDFLESVVH